MPSGVDHVSQEAREFFSMPETITYAGSGLVFVNNYSLEGIINIDGLQPAQEYREAIIKAEHALQSHFANPVTINLKFNLTDIENQYFQTRYDLSAENDHYNVQVSYDQLKQALKAHATTSNELAAVNSLPSEDPSGGAKFDVTSAMARMLDLSNWAPADGDGEITLNLALDWNNVNGVDHYNGDDVVGTLEHEISEVMGRYSELGLTTSADTDKDGNHLPNPDWAPLDLFRYSVSWGVPQHDYTGGKD